MAKKNSNKQILVQTVNVRPVNRRNLDIDRWRNAIKSAESLNPNRVALFDIFDDILFDGHLLSLYNKRVDAILNLELKFFDLNNKENEAVNTLIETTYFRILLEEIIKAKFWGFSLCELEWNPNPEQPSKTHRIDRRHIKPELGLVVREPFDTTGVPYTEHPFALFADSGTLGLLAAAAQYVIYKRSNYSDWAEFNEIYGQPFVQGAYENDETCNLLTQAFEKAGFAKYFVTPKDAEITMHMPSITGSENYRTFRADLNEELSILILGQNLSTKVGGEGSFAASKVHKEVEDEKHIADRDFVIKTLNEKLVPILNNLGYQADGAFKFVYIDDMELSERIDLDTKVSMLVPVADDYFYETYGLPKPTGTQASSVGKQEPGKEPDKEPDKEPEPNKEPKGKNKLSMPNESTWFERLQRFFFRKTVLKF